MVTTTNLNQHDNIRLGFLNYVRSVENIKLPPKQQPGNKYRSDQLPLTPEEVRQMRKFQRRQQSLHATAKSAVKSDVKKPITSLKALMSMTLFSWKKKDKNSSASVSSSSQSSARKSARFNFIDDDD